MHGYFCIDRRHPGPDTPGLCAHIVYTEYSVYNPKTGGLRGHVVAMRAERVDGLMHASDRRPMPFLVVGDEFMVVGRKLPTNVMAAMLIALR